MTDKWKIRKYAVSSLGNEVALPWMLFKPGVIPPKTFHEAYWAACSMGETPSEVFAYVESEIRKARTVEVELPKIELQASTTDYGTTIEKAGEVPLSTPEPGLWTQAIEVETSQSCPTIRLAGPYGQIYWCSWDDVKTTALHLLALHYEKEQQ